MFVLFLIAAVAFIAAANYRKTHKYDVITRTPVKVDQTVNKGVVFLLGILALLFLLAATSGSPSPAQKSQDAVSARR